MGYRSAQAYLRSKLEIADGASESRKDSMLITMGLLAVAEGLESVASSIDVLAHDGGDPVAKALTDGLGDMEVAVAKVADAINESSVR